MHTHCTHTRTHSHTYTRTHTHTHTHSQLVTLLSEGSLQNPALSVVLLAEVSFKNAVPSSPPFPSFRTLSPLLCSLLLFLLLLQSLSTLPPFFSPLFLHPPLHSSSSSSPLLLHSPFHSSFILLSTPFSFFTYLSSPLLLHSLFHISSLPSPPPSTLTTGTTSRSKSQSFWNATITVVPEKQTADS